jgi:predicted thioesterase
MLSSTTDISSFRRSIEYKIVEFECEIVNIKSSNFNSKSGILNNYLLKFRTLTTPEASSEYMPQILVFSFCHCWVYINVKHLYATLVGQEVTASATFLAKDGLIKNLMKSHLTKVEKLGKDFIREQYLKLIV